MKLLDRFRSSGATVYYDVSNLDIFNLSEESSEFHLRKWAVQTCINLIAKSISQSDFLVKNNDKKEMNELFYRLNVKPNQNQTSSEFWEQFVHNLIFNGEVLAVITDTGDIVVADGFSKINRSLYESTFTDVAVGDFTFERTFKKSEVLYLKLNNKNVMKEINGLYDSFGKMFVWSYKHFLHQNQIRATVQMKGSANRSENFIELLNQFISKAFDSFRKNPFALVPQQEGMEYSEKSTAQGGSKSYADETNKVAIYFLEKVATALNIPIALLHGEMADVEKQTKNYMKFCINPLIYKIEEECNITFFTKKEYLDGNKIEIKPVSYVDLFDVAASADKLIASGLFTQNELRIELGKEKSSDERLDQHYITKNYKQVGAEAEGLKGGENE